MTVAWLKVAPWIAAGLLLVTALGMFAAQQRAAGRAEGMSVLVEQQAAVVDSLTAAHAAERKQLADSVARMQQQLVQRDRVAARQTASAVAELRVELTAAQAAQLDTIVASYERRLADRDSTMAATARLHASQLASMQHDMDALVRVNDDLRTALVAANKAPKDGTWKAIAGVATLLAGAAIALR